MLIRQCQPLAAHPLDYTRVSEPIAATAQASALHAADSLAAVPVTVDALQARFGLKLKANSLLSSSSSGETPPGATLDQLMDELPKTLEALAKDLEKPKLVPEPSGMQVTAGHLPLKQVLQAGKLLSGLAKVLEETSTPLEDPKKVLQTPLKEVSKLEKPEQEFYQNVLKAVQKAFEAHPAKDSPTIKTGLETLKAALDTVKPEAKKTESKAEKPEAPSAQEKA